MDFLKRMTHGHEPLLRAINDAVHGGRQETLKAFLQDFPLYAPMSSGYYEDLAGVAAQAIVDTPDRLAELAAAFAPPPPEHDVKAFCEARDGLADAAELKRLFDRHGSDKAQHHDYHFAYGALLGDPGSVRLLLEIGLGSVNPKIVSNMGRSGRPGASLRAFRDYLPEAAIHGADIDPEALFQDDRITTVQVDQTRPDSLDRLVAGLPSGFDLVIDDGLHAPHANLATLRACLPLLRPGGWMVIEDISPAARRIWDTAAALVPADRYETVILRTRSDVFMFLVQRTG